MSTWRPISEAPRDKTHILIRYLKKGRSSRTIVFNEWVVTEAYFVPCYYPDWDVDKTYLCGGEWFDALGRLISNEGSPNTKSLVLWWMPMPEEPECTSV